MGCLSCKGNLSGPWTSYVNRMKSVLRSESVVVGWRKKSRREGNDNKNYEKKRKEPKETKQK